MRLLPWRVYLPVAALLALSGPRAEAGAINLELRPPFQAVSLGDTFEVGLYAVSADGQNQTFLGVQAIVVWDTTQVEFVGLRNLCPPAPCAPDTYAWRTSSANVSQTDGSLVYVAYGPFFDPLEPRPVATAQGLHVVAFQFRTIATGRAAVEIVRQQGVLFTRVDNEGEDILGVIGPPVSVAVGACLPPAVVGVGSRYLRIDPDGADDPMALRVTGDLADPDAGCVSRFVQLDGRLGDLPIMRTPNEWSTVFVTGPEIIPYTLYSVRAECGPDDPTTLVSPAVEARTRRWGDVNGDNVVDITDLSIVLGAAKGVFPPGVIPENVDGLPCVPDGVIDGQDIAGVESALGGVGYPCFTPCEPGPGPEDFGDFIVCLIGPRVIAPIRCVRFDVTGDAHVDLGDFALLAMHFGVQTSSAE